jgi:hypothetical protein
VSCVDKYTPPPRVATFERRIVRSPNSDAISNQQIITASDVRLTAAGESSVRQVKRHDHRNKPQHAYLVAPSFPAEQFATRRSLSRFRP